MFEVGGWRPEAPHASNLHPQTHSEGFISVYLRASAANCRIWVNASFLNYNKWTVKVIAKVTSKDMPKLRHKNGGKPLKHTSKSLQ
jgi:hypothetical protein